MPSQIAGKLDFLMSVTSTSNSQLARELSFDASYISRIRNGKRGIPLHQPFIEPAATYLASRITKRQQQAALAQAMRLESWPQDEALAAKAIEKWLIDATPALDDRFGRLVESVTGTRSTPLVRLTIDAQTGPEVADGRRDGESMSARCFYGNAGKRAAVLAFLKQLAESGEPCELALYSDEPMGWLTDDIGFLHLWASLLAQVIENGGAVEIIHTVTRDVGEMLDAVQIWLPLYLTGAVRSFYCPRLRDGICRRTLLIARGKLALTSNSVEGNTEGMANILADDASIVAACETEFANLKTLCRPLVEVVSIADGEHALETVKRMADGTGSVMFAHNPAASDPLASLATVTPPEMLKEIERHMEHMAELTTDRIPEGALAIAAEDGGFALANLSEPFTMLVVTERMLAAAFAEYLR